MKNRIWASRMRRHVGIIGTLALCALALLMPRTAAPIGTSELFPFDTPGFRASIEWRNSTYGGNLLLRRTLLKVYAVAGEYILLASSAVNVPSTPNKGDIWVFAPGTVTGPVGSEAIPASPDFSCVAQRATSGNADRGRIADRAHELGGPNTAGGYRPCVYQAPHTGIYAVAMLGPDGANSDREIALSGKIDAPTSDFGPNQATSVTAWDISVADRPDATAAATRPGRTFASYLTMLSGGNGQPMYNTVYVATEDGFIYKVHTRGLDPYGFIFYANRTGFLDTDGTPLYRDVIAAADQSTQDQNQLVRLQGGVTLAQPDHPIFFEPPDPAALAALSIPTVAIPAIISDFRFGELSSPPGAAVRGGTFSFNLNRGGGIFTIVVSRDGVNFDPTLPGNRVLRGAATVSDRVQIGWDGRDNVGEILPRGDAYHADVIVQSGEVHFPALDAENNRGGTTMQLLNPPDGICPSWVGGCRGAFYDDRGYLTTGGTLVGVALNGPLCKGNVGLPPDPLYSDPLRGYDSATDERSWGFATGGNPNALCDPSGGFGDKKGLDRWSFVPSNRLVTGLALAPPTAVTLTEFGAAEVPGGVLVRWSTGTEIESLGFQLYRAVGERVQATRVTPALILARGSPGSGATYGWLDTSATPGVSYRYWLQEIVRNGSPQEYGPAQVMPLTVSGEMQLWLPLLAR
jgi:hypothetical protein